MDGESITAEEVLKSEFNLELIKEDLEDVERILYEQSQSYVPLVNQVSRHLLKSGGKRFRPSLLLLSAKLFGYQGRDHLACAAAVEYAHTATLLHDDVIDEARCRRGRPSANRLFGNQASVLVGDYLLFKGFSLILGVKNSRVLDLVNSTSIRMAEGETRELEYMGDLDLSEDDYFSVITNKTAVLIQAACQIGAMLGDAGPEEEESLSSFGLNTGIAFQLVDDALDYGGEEAQWGKEVGKDFMEGKVTLPLLHAYRYSGEYERAKMEKFFKRRCRLKSHFREVAGYLYRQDSIEYTMSRAAEYIKEAKGYLAGFEDSKPRQALLALADYVVERRV
jgi:octaprenyl-diphosphate synthase